MRIAKITKYLAYVVLILGLYCAFTYTRPFSLKFWLLSFTILLLWCILRIISNIGQIIYDIRTELSRNLEKIERSIYYSNALVKEIKDFLGSERDNK